MFRTHCRLALTVLATFLLAIVIPRGSTCVAEETKGGTTVDYTQDIRPLLSDRCFRCHGPDDQTREADLRLDTWDGLTSAPSGTNVVSPGKIEESELLARIRSSDPDLVMPPPDSNKSLTEAERDLLTEWVEQGAAWEQHWSFVPPEKKPVPQAADANIVINEIDGFVQRRLAEQGMQPADTAEPHVLVRRLYLDLVGLLPTTEEATHWTTKLTLKQDEANGEPGLNESGYQELVSHLLDSPHYGERWARPWLDLARYADTNGYEKDRDRTVWPYRDWVIAALNSDMPFDQFTIEQLAGDMLPGATRDQRIATGFHRNTMLNEEGGIDPLEFRFHAMTDRVATTGTTWLGLTLGCCQCHTHKYDPISHREYYQLMAFLNNADEPQLEIPDSSFQSEWDENRGKAESRIAKLEHNWPLGDKPQDDTRSDEQRRRDAIAQAFETWLTQERANLTDWQILSPTEASSNLPLLTIEEAGTIFASGDTAKRDEYQIRFAPSDHEIHALQLETLPDERLPARGPGSTYYEGTLGDFYLTEFIVEVDNRPIKVRAASESYAKNRYGKNPVSAALSVDGDVQTGWSVHDRQGQRHSAVYLLEEPIPANKEVRIRMIFGRHFASSLGKLRVWQTSEPGQWQARDYSAQDLSLLSKKDAELSADERTKLKNTFLMQTPELEKESSEIRKLLARPSVTTTLVMQERPRNNPRPTFRHHRGEYLQPEEQVSASTPGVLHAFPEDKPKSRLEFAKWIVAPNNPLTARVVVNRAWAQFFGTGLVKTLEDFGLQGESPSHPDLLDWLALEFIHKHKWSSKNLHRTIVSSHTYRQSSQQDDRDREALAQRDPDNRMLSVFPRRRLDAEILRDAMLVASQKLVPTQGGPPVKPPQPKGVTELAYGKPAWNEAKGDGRYRRSLYTFAKRTAPYAMFSTFDAPSGEACVAKRTRSNSPLQALTLLNDVMVLELAQATGQRFSKTEEISAGIRDLFQATLTRMPSSSELEKTKQFLAIQTQAFREDIASANSLIGRSPTESSSEEEPAADELERTAKTAAWVALARVLFSLDEFQTQN